MILFTPVIGFCLLIAAVAYRLPVSLIDYVYHADDCINNMLVWQVVVLVVSHLPTVV